MPSRRSLILFFVITAVVYGVLLIPWPGLLTGYRSASAALCQLFLGRIGDGRVTFAPMEYPTLDKDTDVTLQNVKTGVTAKMTVNSRRRMYLPAAFTLALIVAAPIAWRRKILAAILGLVLISIYSGAGIWLNLVNALSEPRMGAISLGPFVRRIIQVGIKVLIMSPVVPYIAALLVFVMVTVRREDVLRLSSAAIKSRSEPSTASAA